MFKEELYISADYRLEDYLYLNLNMDSGVEEWEKAIKIFIDRINGRYFDAIDNLFENPKRYGFSIITLQCLLIDTFVKFRYGPNVNKNGEYIVERIGRDKLKGLEKIQYFKENKRRFRKFLEEFLIQGENKKYISMKFYEDIRCSVVHFGSTENTSRLTYDYSKLFEILENGDISVDISILNYELKNYFNIYINELKDKYSRELRKNFMLAMDYLCGKYGHYEF